MKLTIPRGKWLVFAKNAPRCSEQGESLRTPMHISSRGPDLALSGA
jgi:hypothetical protein